MATKQKKLANKPKEVEKEHDNEKPIEIERNSMIKIEM